MERGLYIAASGMLTEMVRQDQIANDIANASTPGYKPDRSTQRSFGDMLLANQRTGRPIGGLGLGVQVDSVVTDLAPGPLRETGDPLDLAVEGDGFFAVATPQGPRYTRNGRFMAAPDGTLVTALGAQVLGQGGQPVRVRADGTVDPAAVGLFAVPDARKAGDSLFTGAAAGAATGRVRAGALEGSGTDPARAMVDLIASFRTLEAGQRVIRTIDSTLEKAANRVGALG